MQVWKKYNWSSHLIFLESLFLKLWKQESLPVKNICEWLFWARAVNTFYLLKYLLIESKHAIPTFMGVEVLMIGYS